ncbi:MAG: HigA family addiction module antitoxin [Microvirga sp.]
MIEESKVRRSDRAPTHPGALLREDVLPAIKLPITTIARHLHVTRQQLHRVRSEESGISPEMALRLGKFCGNGPNLWIRMQEAYDLWEARRKLGDELDSIPTMELADR